MDNRQIDDELNQRLIDIIKNFEKEKSLQSSEKDSFEKNSDEDRLRMSGEGMKESDFEDDHNHEDPGGSRDTDPTGFYSIGYDIYYTDPSSGVRYCNTTLTYAHLVFAFGADYKVTSITPQSGFSHNRRVKILLEAFSHVGKPYSDQSGEEEDKKPPIRFACGNFVKYVYETTLGIKGREASASQIEDYENGIYANNNSALGLTAEYLTSEADMLPGDLIYWYCPICVSGTVNCPFITKNPRPCHFYQGVHHTGIYIGNGQIIEATSTRGCVIVGDIRQMQNLTIYGYVRLIKENIVLPAVTGLSAQSAGINKVLIRWTSSLYTDGYLIYAVKNGVYAYCGMTVQKFVQGDQCISFYLDTLAVLGENTYYVFPYVTDINGTIYPGTISTSVKANGVCAAVRNILLQCLTSSIVISWSASTGADGYLIYGQRNGGSYEYIGMRTGGNNTTFTDTQASAEGMNLYYVFPFFQQNNQIIPGDVSVCIGGVAYLLDAP